MNRVESRLDTHSVILEGRTDPVTGVWTPGVLQKVQQGQERNRNLLWLAMGLVPILTEALRWLAASAAGHPGAP